MGRNAARVLLLDQLPTLPRCVAIGAVYAGFAGAIVGLVVGLRTYVPTAWFAAGELGVPATVVGGLVGLAVGLVVLAAQRVARR